MFEIVLFEPEIPPNTGNIIRLCANTGARLALIRPLGFELNARSLRRAGLDYAALASVDVHNSLEDYLAARAPSRLIAVETGRGTRYDAMRYRAGDAFLFGPESRGLPEQVCSLDGLACCVHLPMLTTERSLNLANAVSVVVYEAWRQIGFVPRAPS
ncbi:MAG: tRNA (cytidine(34)-2'-O)-methyltransferase [Steroidobacteraceae bacterium]